jgi:hypothetical protein
MPGLGCSAPGQLHTAPSLCRAHGNVTHGGPDGDLVNSPYSTRNTEYPKGSPLGQGRVASQFLDEIFSLIQRNSQDEVLRVFPIENLVINNFNRERESCKSLSFSL